MKPLRGLTAGQGGSALDVLNTTLTASRAAGKKMIPPRKGANAKDHEDGAALTFGGALQAIMAAQSTPLLFARAPLEKPQGGLAGAQAAPTVGAPLQLPRMAVGQPLRDKEDVPGLKDATPAAAPAFVPATPSETPRAEAPQPATQVRLDPQEAMLHLEAHTAVHVGLHHARIVLGHAGEVGNVEVRVRVNAGQLNVEARGDGAPQLLARTGELAAVAAAHGLQLGAFSMGQQGASGGRDGLGPRIATTPLESGAARTRNTKSAPGAVGARPRRYA